MNFVLLFLACAKPAANDTGTTSATTETTDTTETTETTDSGTPTPETTPEMVNMLVYAFDGTFNTALEGATVEVDGTEQTSNSAGLANFEVVAYNEAWVVATMGGDYYDSHFLIAWDGVDFDAGVPLISRGVVDLIGSIYGITPNPGRGILMVNVVGTVEPATPLAGATVSIDSAYDLVLTPDSRSPTGYAVSNTTTGEGYGSVVFANVPPGPVTVSVTADGVDTCTSFASTERLTSTIEAVADAVVGTTWYCR